MRSGFPLRLHYRLELWRSRSGWFDQYISEASWDAAARHDPLADDFVLIRTGGSVTRYGTPADQDRKSTRLNSSHGYISYAVFCLKKKKKKNKNNKTVQRSRRRTRVRCNGM